MSGHSWCSAWAYATISGHCMCMQRVEYQSIGSQHGSPEKRIRARVTRATGRRMGHRSIWSTNEAPPIRETVSAWVTGATDQRMGHHSPEQLSAYGSPLTRATVSSWDTTHQSNCQRMGHQNIGSAYGSPEQLVSAWVSRAINGSAHVSTDHCQRVSARANGLTVNGPAQGPTG